MFPGGPNDDTVDASGQAINYTRNGSDSLLDVYKRLNAEDAAKAAEKAAPPKPAAVNGNGKHEWSESIRTVGMGIVPRGIIDPAELEQWIQFCEASAQTERASFARQLLAQRTAEEA